LSRPPFVVIFREEMMVHVKDLKEGKPKPIPAALPSRHIFPRKIIGFDAPHDRGGYIAPDTEWEECPNCHKMTFVSELHWIGGRGYEKTKVCDCGYWERSP